MWQRESMIKRRRRTYPWRFSIRSLFVLTVAAALYSGALSQKGDTRFYALVVVSLVLVGVLGIGRNAIVWLSFLCGFVLGVVGWWYTDYLDPFHPKDRTFYLVVYTGFSASFGMLIGFLWSMSGRGDSNAGGKNERA